MRIIRYVYTPAYVCLHTLQMMYAANNAKRCSRIFKWIMLCINVLIIIVTASLFQFGNLGDLLNATSPYSFDTTHDFNLDFSDIKDWRPVSYMELGLVFLTLSQAFVLGLYRFHNPDARWFTMRGQAMKMSKTIWTFRTYTGAFNEKKLLRGQVADDVLEKKLSMWRQQVKNNGYIFTNDMAKPKKVLRHGQYEILCKGVDEFRSQLLREQLATRCLDGGVHRLHERNSALTFLQNPSREQDENENQDDRTCCASCCSCIGEDATPEAEWDSMVQSHQWPAYNVYDRCGSMRTSNLDDDHFSPLTGGEYLKHRMFRALRFYQARVPKYRCQEVFFTYVGGILTLAASVCAVFNVPPSSQFWVAVITAFLTFFGRFEQYYDASAKLLRYKNAIIEIEKLKSFWEGLGSLKENKLQNMLRVVDRGEAIIMEVSMRVP